MNTREKLQFQIRSALPLSLRSSLRVSDDPRKRGFIVTLDGFVPYEALKEFEPQGELFNDETRVS